MLVTKFFDQPLSINFHHTVVIHGCDTSKFHHRQRGRFTINLSAAPKNEPLYTGFACEGKHLLRATNVYACAFFLVEFGINHTGYRSKMDDTVVPVFFQTHTVDGRNIPYVVYRDAVQVVFFQIQCFNTVSMTLKLSSKMRTNEATSPRDEKRIIVPPYRLHVLSINVCTRLNESIDVP